jgi:FkbM family methyltransferase
LNNYIKYYKTFIRYGLGYEGDAWFANNYILPFKKKGFYIDIGCYHPLKYSQTYKLYKLGWSGINLDISKESIDLFKSFRSKDKNLNIGISNKAGFENFYFTKKISTTNSLNNKYLKESINFKKKFLRKIQTQTIDQLFEENNISEVDFLKIDCEGMDLSIIKTLDFSKYKINFLSIEFLYESGNFIIKQNKNINSVHQLFFESDIYKILEKNFKLVDHFGFAFLLANKEIY